MDKVDELVINVQKLWCQHCKSLQKENDTVVDCLYNPLSEEGEFSFCAANEDAVYHLLSHSDLYIKDEINSRVDVLLYIPLAEALKEKE